MRKNRIQKKSKPSSSWVVMVLLGLSGLSVAVLAQNQKQDPLRQRAEKIFQMDRDSLKNGKKLFPSHELVALSIAMEFGNKDGMKDILSRLESVKVKAN